VVQRLRLPQGAGVAVEEEAVGGVGAVQALAHQLRHGAVVHQLAGVQDRLHPLAELGAVGHRLAQHVAGGDHRHAQAPADVARLRALARVGRAEQDQAGAAAGLTAGHASSRAS